MKVYINKYLSESMWTQLIISKNLLRTLGFKKSMEPCRPNLIIQKKIPFDEEKISSIFTKSNALASPIRLKILQLLLDKEELCVCEIETALSLKQSKVSYHLATLVNGGLINRRQSGPWSYYSINNNASSILELFGL
jgi:ArsR family transcriptional regulator